MILLAYTRARTSWLVCEVVWWHSCRTLLNWALWNVSQKKPGKMKQWLQIYMQSGCPPLLKDFSSCFWLSGPIHYHGGNSPGQSLCGTLRLTVQAIKSWATSHLLWDFHSSSWMFWFPSVRKNQWTAGVMLEPLIHENRTRNSSIIFLHFTKCVRFFWSGQLGRKFGHNLGRLRKILHLKWRAADLCSNCEHKSGQL